MQAITHRNRRKAPFPAARCWEPEVPHRLVAPAAGAATAITHRNRRKAPFPAALPVAGRLVAALRDATAITHRNRCKAPFPAAPRWNPQDSRGLVAALRAATAVTHRNRRKAPFPAALPIAGRLVAPAAGVTTAITHRSFAVAGFQWNRRQFLWMGDHSNSSKV